MEMLEIHTVFARAAIHTVAATICYLWPPRATCAGPSAQRISESRRSVGEMELDPAITGGVNDRLAAPTRSERSVTGTKD